MRGKFITIEGTEGVGKTTNIEFIQAWLEEKNLPFVCTREPGGTPLAEQIRELLLASREEVVSSTAELLADVCWPSTAFASGNRAGPDRGSLDTL